jgi:hypothetical protein
MVKYFTLMSKFPSLKQQRFTHYQSFDITPDYYLNVHQKRFTYQADSRFDLFDIDIYPSTITTSSKPLLFATIAGMLMSSLGLILYGLRDIRIYMDLSFMALALTALCGSLFYLSYKTMLVYHHRITHQTLFEILVFDKTKIQRDSFINGLNTLLHRLSEYDRSSYYAQQSDAQPSKDGLGYN